MAEYFFELLVEEIPAWMHDAAQRTLAERLAPLGGTATVTTTPRRIIFYLAQLLDKEPDRDQEVKGPPKSAERRPSTRRSGRNGSTSPNIRASSAPSSDASTWRCRTKCWSR